MKDLFKKYAFVFIAGIFFLVVIIAYSINYFTGLTPSKKVDGKEIVYSVDDINKTADEVFDYYFDSLGNNAILNAFTNAIVDEYTSTTSQMKEEAKTSANNVLVYYQQQYGSSYQSTLESILRNMGYETIDDLDDYFVRLAKYDQLIDDYLIANPTSEMSDYQTKQGRVVSHILVKMDDPDNPTDEELEKVENIEKALKDGEDFATVAYTYSDDSSASSGGSLGAMNSDTSYVEEFLEAALALNPGETTSEWVKTTYGWHLIKCDSTDMVDILDAGLRDTILDNDSSLGYTALWQAAQNEGVTFNDADIEAMIKESFGITDETATDDTTETSESTEESETEQQTSDEATQESDSEE